MDDSLELNAVRKSFVGDVDVTFPPQRMNDKALHSDEPPSHSTCRRGM